MILELSQRNRQVLTLLAEGCDHRQISEQIGISPRTVKQHIRVMRLKAGITEGHPGVTLALMAVDVPAEITPARFTLSWKKRKVALGVMRGLTNKQIAAELGTTEHVVKNYMRSILDICGVWSRLELAIYVKRNGGEKWLESMR